MVVTEGVSIHNTLSESVAIVEINVKSTGRNSKSILRVSLSDL